MSAKISVVQVQNTEEQLKFMPLKGSIVLRMAGNVSPLLIKDFIRVLRLSHEDGIYPYPKTFSDLHTGTDMSYVDIDIEMHGEDMHITPKDSFMENTKYMLMISGRAYSISNKFTIDDTEVSSISLNLPFSGKIEIDAVSDSITMPSGKSMFVADISMPKRHKMDAETIEENIPFDIGDGYSITFKDISEVREGSKIVVSSRKSKPMGNDYILEFSTGMAIKIKELKPEDTSSKIKPEDIMNFYNNPGFMHVKGSSISGKSSKIESAFGGNGHPPGSTTTSSSISLTKPIEIRLPNKVFIHLDEPVTKDQIIVSGLAVDIYEAFDNYHLSKMGLYCDTDKIIFEFSVQRSGMVLQIEVKTDKENIVPQDEKWIAIWK